MKILETLIENIDFNELYSLIELPQVAAIRSVLGVCILGLIVFFIIRAFVVNIQLHFARKAATKNPTQENAWRVYRCLCRFGVGINNHPKDWGEYRDMFYKINNSADVPSEIKSQLKARLIKKGLYINNMKIIDNYNQNKENVK